MAKDIKIIIGGDSSRADAAIRSLERTGSQAASILEREFSQLGIKSALVFENQRAAATAAYDKIKSSGLATASELERAQKAHAAAMTRIDEEEHGKRIGLLEKFKTNWLAVTASIAAAWATASKAITLAQGGASFEQQGTGFANLAASYGQSADQIIADLQRVSNGTLSLQQTVEQAGKAMVLGVSAEYLPKLMEMARASARITGETTRKAFNDLVEGVAKGSSELLNNLGIIVRAEDAYRKFAASHNLAVDALTAEQKQQAILNEVLEKGNDIVERGGALGESNAEKMAKFSAAIDNIGNSIGILLSGPMASLAEEMSATVGWLEAYKSGQIGFWEWATTGADAAAEKLKKLRATNLDALVTPEGQEIARRKAEETARSQAEAAAKAKAEADKKASEEAKKKLDKELDVIRKHNDRILDLEKKRISKSLEIESDHLRKLTDNYTAAVKSMDSLIDARKTVQEQLAARNAADLARGAGPVDPLNAYLNQQDQIRRAEETISASFGMSAEEKAKKYADLIDQAASYNQAVVDGSAEIVSAYQTEADYQATKERLQEKISQLLDVEAGQRAAAAEEFGVQMIAAEEKVIRFKDEIERLETLLDRMNNKEVNIIFKATGADQLLAAGGVTGLPTTTLGSAIFHSGTSFVPRDGLYSLSRGEKVLNRNETDRAAAPAAALTIAPVFNISGVSAGGGEKTARELARELEPELRKLAGRYR